MPFYFTYISLRLCLFRFEQHITKMLPITANTLFQPCSPHHVFWHHWNLFLNCDLELISGPWSSGVHFRFEVPSKEIITSRESGWMWRPWKLTMHWNNVIREYFPNHHHGYSHSMGSSTIWLRAQFHDDSVLVWGSSMMFQNNEQMWCPSLSSRK
jgi:hypothetical protein